MSRLLLIAPQRQHFGDRADHVAALRPAVELARFVSDQDALLLRLFRVLLCQISHQLLEVRDVLFGALAVP